MVDESTIVERVRAFFGDRHQIAGPIVVAVSGGPDSVALLRAVRAVFDGAVLAAHLNHGLRGAASNADQQFVAELARTLGVGFQTTRRSVLAEAVGENLEAVARRIRYEWLAEVARGAGAVQVATGHTADDQAETVLFQLLRGTGIDGLAGIAPRRPLAVGAELVRPLLGCTHADVLAYLRALGQEFRVDATNADLSRTRSRIRVELIPRLAAGYNPRVVDVLARLAAQAAEWRKEHTAAGEELLRSAERPRAGRLLVFDRSGLAAASRSRRRLFWRAVWRREGWPRLAMNYRQWDRLAGLARRGPSALDLPGGIRARRRGDVIQVGPSGG